MTIKRRIEETVDYLPQLFHPKMENKLVTTMNSYFRSKKKGRFGWRKHLFLAVQEWMVVYELHNYMGSYFLCQNTHLVMNQGNVDINIQSCTLLS